MRASIIAIVSCLGLGAPVAALAQDAQPAMQTAVSPTGDSSRLICHYSYYEGMIIRRKDCRTQHEWDRVRTDTQKGVYDIQIRSLSSR
jgi:hypothetical protein